MDKKMDWKAYRLTYTKQAKDIFENAVTGRKSFFDEWVRNPF